MGRTLMQGIQGPDVRALQDALNYQIRRGQPLVVDGKFGPLTAARVRDFQKAAVLVVDGKAGPMTQNALFEVTEITLPIIFMPRLQLTPPAFGKPGFGIQPPRLIPPLQWQGPPLPPPGPFVLGPSFRLGPSAFSTLPNMATPANALGIKIVTPTRKDQLDPSVRSRQALVELVEQLPANSKFKSFLVSQIPNPVTRISPPPAGFDWGVEPLFNPLDPKGFGLSGNARFTVRVTQGGDGRPNVVVGAWGDGKVFLDFTRKAGQTSPRVEAEGQVFFGLRGVF